MKNIMSLTLSLPQFDEVGSCLWGERDFTKFNMFLEQHSNQPIRFEGKVYSLCQV